MKGMSVNMIQGQVASITAFAYQNKYLINKEKIVSGGLLSLS